jgi:hypothetical protein
MSKQLETFKKLAPRGWYLSDKCDAILFDALRHVALNEEFDIERANSNGMWLRRPPECGDCGATTSRDMLIGIMTYIHHFKRTDLAQELWDYGVKHNWKMGNETEHPNTRVWATPNIIFTLAAIKNKLTGSKNILGYLPIYPLSTAEGYPSHLTALLINLRGDIKGSINFYEKSILRKLAEKNPNNPLILALCAKWLGNSAFRALSVRILEKTWPQDRLANTLDWGEEWYTQRKENDKNLKPDLAAPLKDHCGGDLLYVYHVLGMK